MRLIDKGDAAPELQPLTTERLLLGSLIAVLEAEKPGRLDKMLKRLTDERNLANTIALRGPRASAEVRQRFEEAVVWVHVLRGLVGRRRRR